jgi:Icc-related predicted phosphoesterase
MASPEDAHSASTTKICLAQEWTMRCLFVADLHYSLRQFDWLLRSATGYDLVVLAGDALDVGSIVDYRAQTPVVRKYLQRIMRVTRLIVCSQP